MLTAEITAIRGLKSLPGEGAGADAKVAGTGQTLDEQRQAMVNSPNPSVAHMAGCVGHEGVCASAALAPLAGGWFGSTVLGRFLLGAFGLASAPNSDVPVLLGGGAAAKEAAEGEKLLFRRGASDTKALLQRDSQAAEDALGIHGVSVSTNPAAKAGQVVRCATCSSVEAAGFKVQQTGRDLNHHTVELPKPITSDIVRTWNELFK